MLNIIRKEDQKLSQWSGGTTREIFIYPADGNYQKREFEFRISTATVELEHSEFTPLPGFMRHLMIIEGELQVKHRDQYEKKLRPFEQDFFDGGWKTESWGKVIDFNLMLRERSGEIATFNPTSPLEMADGRFNFLYLTKGSVEIEGSVLSEGDLIHWEKSDTELKFRASDDAQGIIGSIK